MAVDGQFEQLDLVNTIRKQMFRAGALCAAALLFASGASKPPSLPPPADFVADLSAGRINPEAFDFAARGYWDLPPPDRIAWFSSVIQPLTAAPPADGCSPEAQRRFKGTIWSMLLMQAADAPDWQLITQALRDRLTSLDAKLAEASAGAPKSDARTRELLARYAADQRVRQVFTEPEWTRGLPPIAAQNWMSMFTTRMASIDCDNTAWLKQQIARVGWFDIPTYGAEADTAAWHLVQHADATPDFQSEMLAKLQALPKGSTDPYLMAKLHDRVALARKQPQRYGTQGRCETDGTWKPFDSEDPEHLDERRAALGQPPIAEHAKAMWRESCTK